LVFDRSNPAKSVSYVVDLLRKQGTKGYLYRGQCDDYDMLAPSSFRPFFTGVSADASKILVNPRPNPARPGKERKLRQSAVHQQLVTQFGRTIGNLFAQHYGLSSDVIGVTSDPTVAAFFATRDAPRYQQHAPGGLGVLYRFPHRAPGSTEEPTIPLVIADLMSSSVGAFDNNLRSFFWLYNAGIHDYETEPINGQNVTFPETHTIRQLHTQGFGLSWKNILALWSEAQRTYSPLKGLRIEDSRIRYQLAGDVRPVFIVECEAPREIKVEFNPLINTYTSAQPARILRVLSIDNLAVNPHIERFYFQHRSDDRISLHPAELWPDSSTDPILRYLKAYVAEREGGYLKLFAKADDDLLDPGYQP
jgi:hypothetical protein